MYAAGHLALGYLTGITTSKLVRRTVHLPLLLLIVILPDLDYILPGVPRRGPTHSLVVQGVAAIPFILIYRRRALPYLIALWGHSVSDLFDVAGVQLFWPVSTYNHPVIPYQIIRQTDPYLVPIEALLTGATVIGMVFTGSFWQLMKRDLTTLFLLGPLGALAVSSQIFRLPTVLVVSQVILFAVFTIPLIQLIRHYIASPHLTDTSTGTC